MAFPIYPLLPDFDTFTITDKDSLKEQLNQNEKDWVTHAIENIKGKKDVIQIEKTLSTITELQGITTQHLAILMQCIRQEINGETPIAFINSWQLQYCYEIAQKGVSSAIDLAENLDGLNLKSTSVAQRLDLALLIAQQGNSAAMSAIKNFDKFTLETETFGRFELFKMMLQRNLLSKTVFEVYHFDKLGFIEDCRKLKSAKERVEFCKKLESITDERVMLCKSISKFGFIEDLNSLPFRESVALCEYLMQNFDWLKDCLFCMYHNEINFFQQIKDCESVSERLDMFKQMLPFWKDKINSLFDYFNFGKDIKNICSVPDRLSLCLLFSKLGTKGNESGAYPIALYLHSLGLESLSIESRLEFCLSLIEIIGVDESDNCSISFKNFVLKDLSISELLEIIKKHPQKKSIFDFLMSIKLESYDATDNYFAITKPLPEKIILIADIAQLGLHSASALLNIYGKLGLDNASYKQHLNLLKQIRGKFRYQSGMLAPLWFAIKSSLQNKDGAIGSLARYAAVHNLEKVLINILDFSCLSTDSIKRQVLVELLHETSTLVRSFPNDKFTSFTNPVSPAITILCTSNHPSSKTIQEFDNFITSNPNFSVLVPILDKIMRGHSEIKSNLLHWVAYTAVLLYDLQPNQIESIQKSKILDHILMRGNPASRCIITSNLVRQIQDFPLDFCMEPPRNKNDWIPLTQLLLSSMKGVGFRDEMIKEILTRIKDIRGFKDTKQFFTLTQLISRIVSEGLYQYKIKEVTLLFEVLLKALSKEQKSYEITINRSIARKLDNLNNCLMFFGINKFFHILKEGQDLNELFIKHASSLFDIEDKNNFEQQFRETFGKFREPDAIFTYYRSLCSQGEYLLKYLNIYVNAVLQNKFLEVRSDLEKNPHLKKIFTEKPELKDLWFSAQPPLEKEGYTVLESVDPCDLLLIGTEGMGNCFSIDRPWLNKYLLGDLLNGEVRTILIKHNGKIAASSILRLMWDPLNNTAVLLLEKTYSILDDDTPIMVWAKNKAKLMGIPLVGKAGKELYKGTVKYLGGFVPFNYCDAVGDRGGEIDNYPTVEGCSLLQ